MRSSVVIVEPGGAANNVFSRYMKLPLLGPIYLGSVLRDAGFQVRIFNEAILGRPVEPRDLDADFLLVGGITNSVMRGYEIARMYRSTHPRGRVVMGGIHATFMPEEALEVADQVVTGEAETVIVDLLKHGSDSRIVAGTPPRTLDHLPAPDLSLLAGSQHMDVAPVMTSRGCPFACSFCTVSRMFGRMYRTASIDVVMRDLERVTRPLVFFYDDNLTADPKRTHALLDAMLRTPRKLRWSAQVRTDVARDPELVAKMRAAGCRRVYAGIESLDPAALLAYRKHQTVDDIHRAVSVLHSNRIAIHGMFVLGCDDESESNAKDILEFCRRSRIDSAQFMILTPFPGTPLFDQMRAEARLLHTNWAYYDAMHVVFRPLHRSPIDLQREMTNAFSQFYSYRWAARDGWHSMHDAAGSLRHDWLSRLRCLGAENAVLKIGGHAIVSRFLRENQEYFRMLEQWSPAVPVPSRSPRRHLLQVAR